MFHVHYLETEFLQTVWKLKNKLSWNDYRVVSLYLSSMHIHELLEPDSKLSLFTFYLHILSRLRRSTSILKFTSRLVLRLPLHVPVYFLCNPFRGLSMLSRNMEANRSLRSLIFTVFRVYVLFRIFTKLRLCLRIWWI